jgi:ASTRA-associated protein 1
MGMVISRDRTLALSVAADHFIGRYVVPVSFETIALFSIRPNQVLTEQGLDEVSSSSIRTKRIGNAAIAIRDDGRVCIVAGWDGK